MIKERLKTGVKSIFAMFGLDVRRYQGPSIKTDAFHTIKEIVGAGSCPLVFDVGGNVGQSVLNFRSSFPSSTIHSFEPAPNAYPRLEEVCRNLPGVFCWRYALGSREGEVEMNLNERSVFNSIREPQNYIQDTVYRRENVPVLTLDQFCDDRSIEFIDILKTDTEGFDSEVFKGASRMLEGDRIGLIYFECFFQSVYGCVQPFHETYKFLVDHGFSIVNFYNPRIKDFRLKLNDTLFINDDYAERVIGRRIG